MIFQNKKNRKGLFKALFFVLFISLASCAGAPPKFERATAVAAQKYAKRNYARKHAPKLYQQGSVYLKKAHELFENRVYKEAREAYGRARLYFEKAETKARIVQMKQGGMF